MGLPVQIPDLPSATVANDSDQTIMRQGLTDYRVTMALVRNINIAAMTALPSPAQSSDYFIINRVVASVPTNYKIPFNAVGLPAGVKVWFYMSSAQISASLPGWQIVAGTGDTLIACAGGSIYTTAGTIQGTWSQPTFTLTTAQLPAHSHDIDVRRSSEAGSSLAVVLAASTSHGSSGVSTAVRNTGSGSPIQLANTWRPLANVGNICEKLV